MSNRLLAGFVVALVGALGLGLYLGNGSSPVEQARVEAPPVTGPAPLLTAEPATEVATPTAHEVAVPAPPAPVKKASPMPPAKKEVAKPVESASAPAPAPKPVEVKTEPTPAPAPVVRQDEPVAPQRAPKPRVAKTITLPEGTVVAVRLAEKISSETHTNGDTFSATLDQPIVIDSMVIAERGSKVDGAVVESDPGGKVKGRASIGLQITKIASSDGQRVAVSTDVFRKEADSSVKGDAAKVGAAAGIGAAIGAIVGGGKGAAIGAGAGGAAGTGAVVLTRGKAAELPAETKVSFRLSSPVSLTEKIN